MKRGFSVFKAHLNWIKPPHLSRWRKNFQHFNLLYNLGGKNLPGGGAEGQSSDSVVVCQDALIGQQGERPVRLPHAQKHRFGGQIPQSNHAWREQEALVRTRDTGLERNHGAARSHRHRIPPP